MAGKKKQTKNHAISAQGTLGNVTDYRHDEATRKNNPPAKIAAEGTVPIMPKIRYEYSPRMAPALRFDSTGQADKLPELLQKAQRQPLTAAEADQLADALRNQEPWLEWANKREKRWFDVDPVALHIHERVSPQAILRVAARQDIEPSLFGDPQQDYHEAVQFYRHEIPWTNRIVLGDSLQVMTSLSRREDLAGKVQMVYMDPPYGIKFGSNFQPEVGRREVSEKEKDLTREPEMVKAYRDTWHLGIHSYLQYLKDRLLVARELLCESGSIFLQIGPDHANRVRCVMDEVFGPDNFVSQIAVAKTAGSSMRYLDSVHDYLFWYARDYDRLKYRKLFVSKADGKTGLTTYKFVREETGLIRPRLETETPENSTLPIVSVDALTSQTQAKTTLYKARFRGQEFESGKRQWATPERNMLRLMRSERVEYRASSIGYVRKYNDFPVIPIRNMWTDTGTGSFTDDKVYVVQTGGKIIERCVLMATDPGDLVVDPTCGSGTTAFVSEQWGRRWITTDTSRVAIAIARQRLMTAKYDFFRLKDDGLGVAGKFACNTVPHITLKSIAQNQNLDPIFEKHQPVLDGCLADCNTALKEVSSNLRSSLAAKLLRKQKEQGRKAITDDDTRRWLMPPENRGSASEREAKRKDFYVDLESPDWYEWEVPFSTDSDWPQGLQEAVTEYRKAWRAKVDEVDASIVANAEQEELVDQPEVVRGVVRVSGPFTVEAVQPPEMSLGEAKIVTLGEFDGAPGEMETFEMRMVETLADQEAQNIDAYLDQMMRLLKMDGVRFPNNKEMRFRRLEPLLDGGFGLHAEGRWQNGEKDPDPDGKANVAVVFGPQYGPVTAKLVEEARREAFRRGYEHLVVAGFSFDGAAQTARDEWNHPKLKVHFAHIRPDVNPGMAGLLKEQPGSQLFSVFGQPRTRLDGASSEGEYTVTMEGVDIYNPVDNTVTPTKADKVAAWFVDGDYDGRTFCITQAFFPDKSAWEKLSKALDGIVDAERFGAFSGTESLPFPAGKHKCVAVKVIDPRGNEVMRIHKLEARRG